MTGATATTSETDGGRSHVPNLRRDFSLSAVVAGFISVAVAFSGPLLVVLEAARAADLSQAQTASWVWGIAMGSGVVGAVTSYVSKQPAIYGWSIPGAALLTSTLAGYRFSDAVGAYIVCGLLSLLLGVTGLIGRLLALIPRPVTAAVLAGVLFPFAIKVAAAVVQVPAVAGGLVVGYLVGRRLRPRYAVFFALAAGGVLGLITGQTRVFDVRWGWTTPTFTAPTFSVTAVLAISLPLLIVTAAGQNAPGLIAMRSFGYPPKDRLFLGGAGLVSVLCSVVGCHAINMAAVTAAICGSREAHPDPDRRYVAGIACGLFYMVGAVFATTLVSLFSAIPPGMITALAGMALLGALQSSLSDTMSGDGHGPAVIEAALITLAVTVSGIQPFRIVSAFWGLLAGVVAYAILRPAHSWRKRSAAPDGRN